QRKDALFARGARITRTARRGLVMSEQENNAFEVRSRALFHDSVEGLDMRIRSRLTRARSAALETASSDRRPWTFSWKMWTPAFGVTAAAIVGFALWTGSPPDTQSNF